MKLQDLLGDAFKEGMTLEEVNTALADIELPNNETSQKEIEKLTAALNKSNAEAAENKRKLREKLSEEEKLAADREAEMTAIQKELTELRREKALADHKSQFIALGYEEALADETAQALVDGDTAKLFANQKKFVEQQRSLIKADLMKETPTPPTGGKTTITKKEFAEAGYEERVKLFNENPTLYNELANSNT